jgi:hypothetical protein
VITLNLMSDVNTKIALDVSHVILVGQTALIVALMFLLFDWLTYRNPPSEREPYDV